MIRQAESTHTSLVRQLWKDVFGDKDSFLDLYFTKIYQAEQTLVCLHEGELLASMQLLPYRARVNGKTLSAAYIYAVMTSPPHRGKGYMHNLMLFAMQQLKKQEYAFAFLIPQEEYLFDIYAKYGFEKSFAVEEHLIDSSHERYSNYFVPSIDESYLFYSNFYSKKEAIILNHTQFEVVCEDNINEAGKLIALKNESGQIKSLSIAKAENDTLQILDLLASTPADEKNLLLATQTAFPACNKIHLRKYPSNDSVNHIGMIHYFDKNISTAAPSPYASLLMNS